MKKSSAPAREPTLGAVASASPVVGEGPRSRKATLLWVAVGIIALARIAQFWGLHYGSTDDLKVDFDTMQSGPFRTALDYALRQARVFQLLDVPLYASSTMSLGGSGWYDLLNLGSFIAGSLLPVAALHRYLSRPVLQLYVIVYFSSLPLLFAYCPPYGYPTYMFAPLAFCGAAMFFFDQSRGAQLAWRRTILLALACVSLFLALCSYESVTLMSAIFLTSAFWLSSSHGNRLSLFKRREVQAAMCVCGLYLGLHVGWRLLFPPSYNDVTPVLKFSLPEMTTVVGTLSLTSSIFARYFIPQILVYTDFGYPHQFMQPLYAATAGHLFQDATVWQLSIAGLTAIATYKVATSIAMRWSLVRAVQLAGLAAIVFFLPNAPYAFLPKMSNLVLTGQLTTYTGTAFSHLGFALLFSVIVMTATGRSKVAVRAALAVLAAVVAGWASLTSSEFNQISAVYAREQGVKWTAIHYLAACRDYLPAPCLNHVTAPRLWNFSSTPIAWIDGPQYQHYWDVLASKRYRLNAHFYMQPQTAPKPLTLLDYRLEENGALSGVVIGIASDGVHFRDVFIIKDSATVLPAEIRAANSGWLYQGPENTTPCGHGLQIVRFTSPDLNLGSAQVYDLPNVSK